MPERVEAYKLTDEQKAFTKSYKQLKQVESLLKSATFAQQQKTRSLSELWRELNRQFLMLQPPGSATQELQGQEERGSAAGAAGGASAFNIDQPEGLAPGDQRWMMNY